LGNHYLSSFSLVDRFRFVIVSCAHTSRIRIADINSLQPRLAHSITKALGATGSIFGRTLPKPSNENAGSIRRASAAVNLPKISPNIRKSFQE
jgi:hypothetical protein